MIKPSEWSDGEWERLSNHSEVLEQLLLNPQRESPLWIAKLASTLKALSLYLEEAWKLSVT